MKLKNEIWSNEIDKKYADVKTRYGAYKKDKKWIINLWQPLAKNVELLIFDSRNPNKLLKKVKGLFKSPNWTWTFQEDLNAKFYQYEITQSDDSINLALDPYAKSMASFDWEGKKTNVGKAAFVDYKYKKELYKLKKINDPQPIIYEVHIRDLTSLRQDVTIPGSFNAIKEINFANHLKDLGITHVQFLPIHNCYALNENDKSILAKGQGNGWKTNYNWGYDPHNYFSINGWYSSNPNNPYSRMNEFKDLVSYLHKYNIKVIVDVVYNHMFHNSIMHNIMPWYYFREDSQITPVDQVPFASNRLMARRIIVDSLEHFVKFYDVDGFRFDLSTFIDKETLFVIAQKLRKLKPNLVLHGEAWDWTDLNKTSSFNKAHLDNDIDFAYFNDTTRNAIKGQDDAEGFDTGIIGGNAKGAFSNYLSSIIGGIKNFKQNVPSMTKDSYARFTNYPNISLQYAACHDGHTLWDKVNLTTKGNKKKKFEYYRQAIMLQQLTMGRTLYLGGTELLYTKPNDKTGQDGHRFHSSDNILDIFNLGKEYNENTYKTTDYSNGFRWNNFNKEIKENIFNFIKALNKFRQKTQFFNLSTEKEINESLIFKNVDSKKCIIDFEVVYKDKIIKIIHNFSNDVYEINDNTQLIFSSKMKHINKNKVYPKSSVLLKVLNRTRLEKKNAEHNIS